MDQDQASEALNSSSGKRLNAEAAAFVPRAAAALPRLLQPMYARPRVFVSPMPLQYYGFETYCQQDAATFFRYNVNPVARTEHSDDGNDGSSASSVKNVLPDAFQKVVKQFGDDYLPVLVIQASFEWLYEDDLVEFYFSDINLATTDQLFRFMAKDPEGYVPLSVVASFKKVKNAITDNAQLASILRSSNKLVVSEDGQNIKRQHPLTESDMEQLQSRIVIAENLPEDHSHQKLMKIFSSIGSVKSIRTCAPQNLNGKTGKGDRSHFTAKSHAFVEYESVEVAEKAVAELQDESNWRNGLKVRLLLSNPVNSTQARIKKAGQEGQLSGKRDEASVREMQSFKENRLEDTSQHPDAQNHELQLEDYSKGNAQKKGHNGNGGGKGNKGKGHGQTRGRPHQHSVNGGLPSPDFAVSTEKLSSSKASPVPRMPNGTKGFSMGRGKPLAITTA